MEDKKDLVNHEDIELLGNYNEDKNERSSHRHFKHKGKTRPIDFVLVVDQENNGNENEERRSIYFSNLRRKRLKISPQVLSQDQKVKFWHVYAPFDVLCDIAEDLSLRLPTVRNDIVVTMWYDKALTKFKTWWNSIDPFIIKNPYFQTPENFFADTFDKNRLNEFYNGNDRTKLFPQAQRSRLVSYILESTPFGTNYDENKEVGREELIRNGVFTAMYPCHDGPLLNDDKTQPAANIRQKLTKEWASFRQMFHYQPIDAIKDYFGVKVAFYYDWLGFYTCFLVPATIIGLLCFFYGMVSNIWFEPIEETCYPKNASLYYMCPLCDKLCSYYLLKDFSCLYAKVTHSFDNDATAFFAVFMSIWSVIYLEYWKRRQWTLSYKWHTMDFIEEEVVRPQYSISAKKFKKNPVSGKMEPVIPKKEYLWKMMGIASVVIFFIALVVAAMIGVIVYRAVIFGVLLSSGGSIRSNSKLFVTATAAVINLIIINVLKLVYKKLAVIMTDWENPRTRSSYEKSFTLKMFWFQFVNTYASVFYIAFFKSEIFVGWPGNYERFGSQQYRLEGCSAQGCFLELCVQLVILMAGQQLLGNVVEILWPYLQKKYKSWKHNIKKPTDVPVWEADYQLTYQEQLSLFWEYQEVALQYGFVTMFVAAFPLAPLIALITNLVEIRIDAVNMVKSFCRPVAYQSAGIGVWYDILVTVTAFSVLINGFVLSLTSEFIPRLIYKYQFSADGSLKGYVHWSLSSFNISDFTTEEIPEKPYANVNEKHQFCRFPGYHTSVAPYAYSKEHWEILTIRLMFAFIFQWTVTAASRTLAWIIPDRPRSLDLTIKRQEYLAREALHKYKIKTGKRKPDKENSASEDEDEEKPNVRLRHRNRSRSRDTENGNHSKRSSRNIESNKNNREKCNSGRSVSNTSKQNSKDFDDHILEPKSHSDMLQVPGEIRYSNSNTTNEATAIEFEANNSRGSSNSDVFSRDYLTQML